MDAIPISIFFRGRVEDKELKVEEEPPQGSRVACGGRGTVCDRNSSKEVSLEEFEYCCVLTILREEVEPGMAEVWRLDYVVLGDELNRIGPG